MCRAVRRLSKQLGRRGVALMLLGTGKILFGLGYVLHPEPDPRGLGLLTRTADLRVWAWLWILCGAITASCAWLRIGRDRWGFIAAQLPPLIWGGAYLWGAVIGDYPRGLALAGWFATSHVGMILWAASVPEYEVPHPRRRKDPA
ncbi:hypothetical protein [Streptomyces sp. MJP52]|uniref:hypothetical protein n=1 Tax=Streptomyces sp. MJP52 TaxID=2940555 RepID=UPI0024734512|nr:hypothetical protein [Streptomyces sp. MJP52]MDH6226196.1 hypothetical protein [Streptomyces sp. MJP52]